MKKLSIILSLIILLFCTTAFVACGEESGSGNESATSVSESVGQEDENAEKPTYSGTNKLRIGMWSGIPTEVDGKKLTDEELLGYYRDLAAYFDGKGELKVKPEEAMRVMKVMEAAFESDRTGETIHGRF